MPLRPLSRVFPRPTNNPSEVPACPGPAYTPLLPPSPLPPSLRALLTPFAPLRDTLSGFPASPHPSLHFLNFAASPHPALRFLNFAFHEPVLLSTPCHPPQPSSPAPAMPPSLCLWHLVRVTAPMSCLHQTSPPRHPTRSPFALAPSPATLARLPLPIQPSYAPADFLPLPCPLRPASHPSAARALPVASPADLAPCPHPSAFVTPPLAAVALLLNCPPRISLPSTRPPPPPPRSPQAAQSCRDLAASRPSPPVPTPRA